MGLQFTFVFIVFFYCAFYQTKKAREAGAEVYAIGVAAYVKNDVCYVIWDNRKRELKELPSFEVARLILIACTQQLGI